MKNKQLLFSITKKDLIVDWFSGSEGLLIMVAD